MISNTLNINSANKHSILGINDVIIQGNYNFTTSFMFKNGVKWSDILQGILICAYSSDNYYWAEYTYHDYQRLLYYGRSDHDRSDSVNWSDSGFTAVSSNVIFRISDCIFILK